MVGSLLSSCTTVTDGIKTSTAHSLVEQAASTSCSNPLIIRHDGNLISDRQKQRRISKLGFNATSIPVVEAFCEDSNLSTYNISKAQIALAKSTYDGRGNDIPDWLESHKTRRITVRHMTSSQVRADKNVHCKGEYARYVSGQTSRTSRIGEECRYAQYLPR